ncbi:hypothetical protein DFP73DRAFT_524832 [Morchella snyderi]|nr:hypothetical protein DFP73DRAFT_524832 [Morchella snyderi]
MTHHFIANNTTICQILKPHHKLQPLSYSPSESAAFISSDLSCCYPRLRSREDRFRKGASPGKRDDNTNAHGVDLDSGHVDYNGFPPLSRTYCDAGLWPAGEVMSNLNSERNYTYRIPRVKRFHQDYSLPTTATHPNSGPCGKSAYENLKKHDDIDRKTRPRLTIRNPTPSDGTISKSSTGVGDIPCGGISPYESRGIDDVWGGSLLTVQPVTFGRRSIDIHRAEFSEFLTGRANVNINIRCSSCPSCHLKGRANIIKNPNNCLDGLARPRTARANHCNQPPAGEIVDIPLAHRKVNSGDYTDVFGTFGVCDGFSVPGFCQPRAKNTHPRLEDIFPTTNDRRITWAADSVAHQGPGSALFTETETLNPLSNTSSNSLNSRMSSASPADTAPQRKGGKEYQHLGSVIDPPIETGNIKTQRLSWADNTTIKDCLVPTIILDKPSPSGIVDPLATTTGRYVFKLGSLKIGIGFAPNARAKSPYPRDTNNTPLDECRSAVIEEPTPRSKWATFNMHSRRAYPYLMKARSSISLRRTCVSPASTGGPRQSPLAAADSIEISVEGFRGRSRYNIVSNLSMIDEFRRKNDLLAMETGYRIPERVESPTRSEKIELYGEDLVNGDFICRARRRLRKVFNVSGHTR